LKDSFQIFLDSLLRMKADSVKIGGFSRPIFPSGSKQVCFGFVNPFNRQGIHT